MADEIVPPPPPPPAPRTEPLGIVSLVLAILSWFSCFLIGSIPAIVLGHVSRSKIRKSNGVLTGMNIGFAALLIAYLNIPFGVLGGIMLVDMIRSERVRLHELAVENKEIASDDNKLKIAASGFWVKRTDLNNQATLQAAHKSEEMYVIVIGDLKSTMPNTTLRQHHQLTRDHIMQGLENGSATQPASVTIDGHPALQDEISGTMQRTNLVYLHTTVDEGDSFQQVLAWTLKPRWKSTNRSCARSRTVFTAKNKKRSVLLS